MPTITQHSCELEGATFSDQKIMSFRTSSYLSLRSCQIRADGGDIALSQLGKRYPRPQLVDPEVGVLEWFGVACSGSLPGATVHRLTAVRAAETKNRFFILWVIKCYLEVLWIIWMAGSRPCALSAPAFCSGYQKTEPSLLTCPLTAQKSYSCINFHSRRFLDLLFSFQSQAKCSRKTGA